MEIIEKHRPEIIFLDIRMPGLTGMEVAQKIACSCRVVFVTAYDEYAVEAFDKGAMDYLLKPVTRDRLEKTVKRLQAKIAVPSKPSSGAAELTERLLAGLAERKGPSYLRWLRVQQKDGVRLIPVEEVCYFQASDKYTLVITKEGNSRIRKTIQDHKGIVRGAGPRSILADPPGDDRECELRRPSGAFIERKGSRPPKGPSRKPCRQSCGIHVSGVGMLESCRPSIFSKRTGF